MSGLAGEVRVGVVIGEGDVELDPVAQPNADDVIFEAGNQTLVAQDQRHAFRAAALERDSVPTPGVADDHVVALPGGSVLDGCQRSVLVAPLVDHLVDGHIRDLLDLGLEVEVAVVTQLDVRPNGHGRAEDQRLAFLGLLDVDLGLVEGQDELLDQRVAIGIFDEVLDRLVEHRALTEHALEHRSGALPGRKPGTRVRRARRWTAWSTARLRRSGGSSTSSFMVLLGPGVAVTFIGRPVYPPTFDRANDLAAVSAGLISARAYPSSDAHSQ